MTLRGRIFQYHEGPRVQWIDVVDFSDIILAQGARWANAVDFSNIIRAQGARWPNVVDFSNIIRAQGEEMA